MILITGATGFIGRHLVERLLKDGYRVRCLVPSHKQNRMAWQHGTPEVVLGTLMDEEVLFRAVTGVHTIFHLESAQWWGRPRDLERVDVAGTRNLLEAARAARVGRVITLSHLGATPAAAYPLLRVKGQAEELIRSSGLAYTIIRPGLVFGEDDAFFNHIAMMLRMNGLFFLMPGRGEVVVHPIYIHDLIEVLVRSLSIIDTVDRVIEIGGPEYMTLHDLIRTVMRVSGRHRAILPIPPYLLRFVSGATSRILPRSFMTPQWMDILATNRTAHLGNIFRYFGFQPRRFEDTLLTYMRGRNDLIPALRYPLRRRPRGI